MNDAAGFFKGDTVLVVDGFSAAITVGTWLTIAGDDIPQRVVGTSGGATPVEITITPGLARDVAVSGSLAYVTDELSGLQIIDVSDPSAPVLVGSYDTPGIALRVAVSGSLAFVADYKGGLQILRYTGPVPPAP
ncbi:hypothetical protein IIC65_06275 [Candidatus Sumerlaeota bacterium]|nr:hypothetical protein [Candidatus Sumerlaeota bacterium]